MQNHEMHVAILTAYLLRIDSETLREFANIAHNAQYMQRQGGCAIGWEELRENIRNALRELAEIDQRKINNVVVLRTRHLNQG